ncbi:4Fe-4S ferredoxin iron-sulfur binding domain-containing protein [Oleidesulfovibrio alaskensis G20]|jgi:ferredoxin|uniref:4Fe-4S ferredoxin iron-sulfur binding domain-containing protein n=1 Tax=Oleidesulfovibrio alaskensis (strain ATCC BAA-1058 / DSM 17464 / G20) TaxID=207559 RepID=Q30WX9_OLEA2|nr:EFR1 family ferrodoxin [Oleidesulfovibrio alaskensis]ABB39817.1 4Fe-4S ferredoxin iron-sulfur binding domain-containing protein [Oleidesulfovibrio alaskensis G20]MBG0773430.1 4Fe-4S binding protein [Oleidesulfovibrio alaskensis]
MKIRSVKAVFFSPTGTTRRIAECIGRAAAAGEPQLTDLTLPQTRGQKVFCAGDELLILAVPVYRGRVPGLLRDWLDTMLLDGTPAVCVAVYGNRAYDDALLELKDLVSARGGVVVACAAFVGEHSYSAADTPVAAGRPDAEDCRRAEEFGEQVGRLLSDCGSAAGAGGVAVPGNRPYIEMPGRSVPEFIGVDETCTECGVCAAACPVEAIEMAGGPVMDMNLCIFCCACIRCCPEQARYMKEGVMKDLARRLADTCSARKEPEFFFARG